MKKTYIAPEVEIKRFNTEDIMAGSAINVTATSDATTYDSSATKVELSYESLYSAN